MVKLTKKDKLKYYKNKELAEQLIKQDAVEDGHVIYGARAINAQLPTHLQKNTEDYDVFVNNSKKEANEMEEKLDKKFGGDFFSVKQAKYPKTTKVKSNVTGDTVVDYTTKKKFPKSTNILGAKYAKLNTIKKGIKKTLKDEKSKFRWDKDKEALQRINLGSGGFL